MDIFNQTAIIAIMAGAIRAGTPLLYTGIGELIYERSGVINIGLEGIMLVGAMAAVWAQVSWGNLILSISFALICGAFFGFIHGFLCVRLKTDQIATGLAMFILCFGLTSFWGDKLVGERVIVQSDFSVPILSRIPIVGDIIFKQDIMVYLAVILVFFLWFFLNRTKLGIMLRATGDSAKSAEASGIPVIRIRLIAGTICGAFCGLGGAHLSLLYASQWQENMVAGRGWIALVMVIFAFWRPFPLLLGAYLFGGLNTLHLNLQAAGVQTSPYILGMLPFVITIIVLVMVSVIIRKRPTGMPYDLGKTYYPYS